MGVRIIAGRAGGEQTARPDSGQRLRRRRGQDMAQKRETKGDESAGLAGRPVRESQTEMVEFVLPQDTNVLGNILGGRVMHLVDICAAISANRHSRSIVVTASVDHIDFRNPIRVGELIVLKASVNRAFRTSMEIGVK